MSQKFEIKIADAEWTLKGNEHELRVLDTRCGSVVYDMKSSSFVAWWSNGIPQEGFKTVDDAKAHVIQRLGIPAMTTIN